MRRASAILRLWLRAASLRRELAGLFEISGLGLDNVVSDRIVNLAFRSYDRRPATASVGAKHSVALLREVADHEQIVGPYRKMQGLKASLRVNCIHIGAVESRQHELRKIARIRCLKKLKLMAA